MNRPELIRILGAPWTIVWMGQVADHPLVKHWKYGATDQAMLTISIRDDVALYQQQDTLLHEVVHASLMVTGQEVDEDAVWALTPVLLDAFRSNPELVAFLMEGAS